MKRLLSLGVSAILVAGCGMSRASYELRPGVTVETVEVRMPTSTVSLGIVTEGEKVIAVVGGNARPLVDIPLTLGGRRPLCRGLSSCSEDSRRQSISASWEIRVHDRLGRLAIPRVVALAGLGYRHSLRGLDPPQSGGGIGRC